MRPALSAAILLAALGAAVPAAEAEWLVLVGGKKIQTEGPWTLKGDLLTVHETTGRILTVGTSTVDAAACLRLNGGSLRIESVSTPPPPGAPVARSEIAPAAPAAPAAAGAAARPATAAAKGRIAKAPGKGAPSSTPLATGGATAATTAAATKAAATPSSGPAASPAKSQPAGGDAGAAAAKQARQAQLQREMLYKQIVDGCAHMFVVDRVGFQRCVDAQTKSPPL